MKIVRIIVGVVVGLALVAIISGMLAKHTNNAPIFSTQPPLPPVPVEIQFRKSLMGNGFVFRFKNTRGQELFCTVTVRNASTGKVYRLDLQPNETKEIGSVQGWQAFPGDICKVEADNFSPENGQIPR
jgi:hypothetical protein